MSDFLCVFEVSVVPLHLMVGNAKSEKQFICAICLFWLFKTSCGFPVPVAALAAFLVAFVLQQNFETSGGEGFSEETFKLACKLLAGRVFKSRVNYTLRRANYIFWRRGFELVQSLLKLRQSHPVVEILWVEYTMADTQVSHDSESVLTVTSSNPAVSIEVCNENTPVSGRKNETTMEDKQISKCAPTVNSPNPTVTINICNENAPASESAPTITSSNPAVAIDIYSGNTLVSESQNEVAMEDEQVSKRSPPHIPEIVIPEAAIHNFASDLRLEVNRSFAILHEVPTGRDLKKCLLVVAGLVSLCYWKLV